MKKSFTLVEILAVVFLIGILTAIGFGVYTYAMNSARENSSKALIARLQAALDACNTKFGYYPPATTSGSFNKIQFQMNSNGQITEISFQNNVGSSSACVSAEYRTEFLKVIDGESLKKYLESVTGTTYELRDAWGAAVYYAYPGKFNTTGYDLYSAGADNRIGKDADALSDSSLNGTSLSDFKDASTGEKLSDDLFTF